MNPFLLITRLITFPLRMAMGWALRRPLYRAEKELSKANERVLIPSVPAKFTGASWLQRPRGDGIIALTETALRFWPLLGQPIRIPREEIQEVELRKWFRGYWRAGSKHLVLELPNGRSIAFIVPSPEKWIRLLNRSGNKNSRPL